MSILAITAAHFVAIPVRYAVGRWSNLSTSTLLVFNATDLGLHTLATSILRYVQKKHHWGIPKHLLIPVTLAIRAVCCLTAVYAALKLTNPILLKDAALTHLVSGVAVYIAVNIVWWAKGEK